jgi:hypothetical protein
MVDVGLQGLSHLRVCMRLVLKKSLFRQAVMLGKGCQCDRVQRKQRDQMVAAVTADHGMLHQVGVHQGGLNVGW